MAANRPAAVRAALLDPALGKANPYGVYDLAANTGWVSVGTDHDTAAFAVNTIRSWWQATGRHTYPEATRLLISADGGGSNGSRTRAWKTELAALAAQTGLAITVSHLPPGTSKWNKIEHRLFSHGLKVHAELDHATYPVGVKIPDQQMHDLEASGILTHHDFHGEWNYTLHPVPTRVDD